MTWKAPYRRSNEVTQSFSSGVVIIYASKDTAPSGYQPVEAMTQKIALRYEERRLGLQRYYEARQNQIQVERVIRTPRAGTITSQDVAVTEDGRRYRIDLVQSVYGVWPPSLDLTLVKYEQEAAQNGVV